MSEDRSSWGLGVGGPVCCLFLGSIPSGPGSRTVLPPDVIKRLILRRRRPVRRSGASTPKTDYQETKRHHRNRTSRRRFSHNCIVCCVCPQSSGSQTVLCFAAALSDTLLRRLSDLNGELSSVLTAPLSVAVTYVLHLKLSTAPGSFHLLWSDI